MSDKVTKGKTVIVAMDDQELTFGISLAAYNDYVNKVTQKNKVQPTHNFMIRCAADDATKAAVKQCYENALTMELFAEVLDGYKPTVEFAVKK